MLPACGIPFLLYMSIFNMIENVLCVGDIYDEFLLVVVDRYGVPPTSNLGEVMVFLTLYLAGLVISCSGRFKSGLMVGDSC